MTDFTTKLRNLANPNIPVTRGDLWAALEESADHIDLLTAGLQRIAEGMGDSESFAQNLLDSKA